MSAVDANEFPALDFYARFYDALPRSRAYSEFCRQLYGMDLGQQGFCDLAQIDALLDAVQLQPGDGALDLGCGDGRIAEYVSDRTGARVTGLDLIPAAISRALERTEGKRDRLRFVAGSISALDRLFEHSSFDVLIAIDSLYFTDLNDTIRQMKRLLAPGGRIGIFYALGADPWHPAETFAKETLQPDSGPLAAALRASGLQYRWWDFTEDDYEHARRKKAIIEALRPTYATEGDRFLVECRLGEADGVMTACEAGVHARHLFLAWE
jgi:ubiquinone/menaquinone biosynthesis C-methylase UbiE